MSSLVLAIILVFGYLAGLVAFQIDKKIYCALPYCGTENIVCLTANYSFACRPRTRLVDMSSASKDTIIRTINEFRNRAAAGLTRTLYPAARMARISWSEELEHFAMMDVLSCVPTPRPCMTSPNFPNMGSIFDTEGYPGKKQDSLIIILDMIGKWTSEGRYVTRKQTIFLADRADQRSVFRVALLMSERNTHMGCAAVKFDYQRFNYLYLSCTFATVNILGVPMYRSANQAGKRCQERDTEFRNLCAVGEKYPENLKLVELNKYMN